MLNHPTHQRLIALGLTGMAKAFEEQRRSPDLDAMPFEERIGFLVDREAAERDTKRFTTRLEFAALRLCGRCRFAPPARHRPRRLCQARRRRLDRPPEARAGHRRNRPGQEWIACALGHNACRDNRSVLYHRVPRLFETLALARGDVRYGRVLKTLGRVQLPILDDGGLSVLNAAERRDLLEILDDCHGRASTIAAANI